MTTAKTIWLVNDEPYVLQALGMMLRQACPGVKIEEFAGGLAAWNELAKRQPELLITGDTMGGRFRPPISFLQRPSGGSPTLYLVCRRRKFWLQLQPKSTVGHQPLAQESVGMPRFVIQDRYVRSYHFEFRLAKDGGVLRWIALSSSPKPAKHDCLFSILECQE